MSGTRTMVHLGPRGIGLALGSRAVLVCLVAVVTALFPSCERASKRSLAEVLEAVTVKGRAATESKKSSRRRENPPWPPHDTYPGRCGFFYISAYSFRLHPSEAPEDTLPFYKNFSGVEVFVSFRDGASPEDTTKRLAAKYAGRISFSHSFLGEIRKKLEVTQEDFDSDKCPNSIEHHAEIDAQRWLSMAYRWHEVLEIVTGLCPEAMFCIELDGRNLDEIWSTMHLMAKEPNVFYTSYCGEKVYEGHKDLLQR